MQGVSWLGGGVPRWTLALLLAVLLWRSAGRRPAFLLAATALAANLASSLLKNLFDRPRPGLIPHLDHVSSWSYPSGHATRSEERRVGKECVSTCRSRLSPYH